MCNLLLFLRHHYELGEKWIRLHLGNGCIVKETVYLMKKL